MVHRPAPLPPRSLLLVPSPSSKKYNRFAIASLNRLSVLSNLKVFASIELNTSEKRMVCEKK
jgi:hypothetical protein